MRHLILTVLLLLSQMTQKVVRLSCLTVRQEEIG